MPRLSESELKNLRYASDMGHIGVGDYGCTVIMALFDEIDALRQERDSANKIAEASKYQNERLVELAGDRKRQIDVLQENAEKLKMDVITADLATEAMAAKVQSMAPHLTCGCSYDKADDICAHHSPRLLASEEQLAQANQKIVELEAQETNPSMRWAAKCLWYAVFRDYEKHYVSDVTAAIERMSMERQQLAQAVELLRNLQQASDIFRVPPDILGSAAAFLAAYDAARKE